MLTKLLCYRVTSSLHASTLYPMNIGGLWNSELVCFLKEFGHSFQFLLPWTMNDQIEFLTYDHPLDDNKSKMRHLIQCCIPTNQIHHTIFHERNAGGYLVIEMDISAQVILLHTVWMVQPLCWLLKDHDLDLMLWQWVCPLKMYHPHLKHMPLSLISSLPLLSLLIIASISTDDDKLSASEPDPVIMLSWSTLGSRDLDESTLHSCNLDCGLLILKYQHELSFIKHEVAYRLT